MRKRERHRDHWRLPSGRAEVELFTFWENDLHAEGGEQDAQLGVLPVSVRPRPVGPARAHRRSLLRWGLALLLWTAMWLAVVMLVG